MKNSGQKGKGIDLGALQEELEAGRHLWMLADQQFQKAAQQRQLAKDRMDSATAQFDEAVRAVRVGG